METYRWDTHTPMAETANQNMAPLSPPVCLSVSLALSPRVTGCVWEELGSQILFIMFLLWPFWSPSVSHTRRLALTLFFHASLFDSAPPPTSHLFVRQGSCSI